MKKLYFIQYLGNDLTLENKIKSLGRHYPVFGGWVVETISEAKQIYEFLTPGNSLVEVVIFGLDKNNYWGRHDQALWSFFK